MCAAAWLGVTASTKSLFENVVLMPATVSRTPDELSETEIEGVGLALLAREIHHVILSGADLAQFRLASFMKALAPNLRFDVLWHSNYVQLREDGQWKLFRAVLEAAHSRLITKVGVVKKGMEAFFESLGCDAEFVMNYVAQVPSTAAQVNRRGIQIGLWPSTKSYTKLPHATLAALARLEGVTLNASNLDQRCLDIVELLGIPTGTVCGELLTQDEVLQQIGQTHLTMSVTFAEACPMLPLQSFGLGVPCLVGPTSHLFEDCAFLRERAIVPYPDRADVIADYATRALADRDRLVAEYRSYAVEYNDAACRSVEAFIE